MIPNTTAWPKFHNALHRSPENALRTKQTSINTKLSRPSDTPCIRHGIIRLNDIHGVAITLYHHSQRSMHDLTCAAEVTMGRAGHLSLQINDKTSPHRPNADTSRMEQRIPAIPTNDKNELQLIQTSACRENDASLTTFAHAVMNCILRQSFYYVLHAV